jgi:hypothetical protein
MTPESDTAMAQAIYIMTVIWLWLVGSVLMHGSMVGMKSCPPSRDAWGYVEGSEEFYHEHPELRGLLDNVSLWVTVVIWPIAGTVGVVQMFIRRWRAYRTDTGK